jgi:putative DNA primase/helicase
LSSDGNSSGEALGDAPLWADPVNGSLLLKEMTAAMRKYVVAEQGAAEVAATWAVHTHALDAFSISPRLGITSAVMRCGKSTLLDVLSCLVHRPMPTVNTTAAAVFRTVDALHPTLLVDEADTFLLKNQELRGILNSGHRRSSAIVLRADRRFSTWSPVAIALIGRLPATLEDRAVEVRLQRRRHDETISPFRMDKTRDLQRLKSMAARWASDTVERLRKADPIVPKALENREADNWRPLLAIADVAGGDWPERMRRIAERVCVMSRGDEQSAAVMLLEDLYVVFSAHTTGRIPSGELVANLIQLEDRPWSEWRGGRPITKKAVANLLAPFRIGPCEMRVGSQVLRGYDFAQFEDAFARYVSAQGNRYNATAVRSGVADPARKPRQSKTRR